MRKTVHKWFWLWDFEKEEKWLRDMAAKGLALTSVHICTYDFEECTPNEYAIRLEMLNCSPEGPEGQQYIRFVEETGAEYLGKVKRWVYFRKKRELGEFELHGDNATRIQHLKGIIRFIIPLLLLNTGIGIYNLLLGIGKTSELHGMNLSVGIANLAITLLCGMGMYSLVQKKKRLEKDGQLFE